MILTKLFSSAQGNPLYYLNRANAKFNLGKYQETLNDYDKVLSFDAKNNQALFYRGVALYALNRKNEAMESLRRSCDAGYPEACTILTQITLAR